MNARPVALESTAQPQKLDVFRHLLDSGTLDGLIAITVAGLFEFGRVHSSRGLPGQASPFPGSPSKEADEQAQLLVVLLDAESGRVG